LFKILFSVQESQMKKAEEKKLEVACLDRGNAIRFVEILRGYDDLQLVDDVPEDSVQAFIQQDRLDGVFVIDGTFDEQVADFEPGRIDFYYKSADDQRIIRNRLTKIVDEFEEEILEARFQQLELSQNVVEGVDLQPHNVASMEERFGKTIGGFLPYIFILFCFMGAMYPAIDLGAGEKERGTLETLLTAPVNRFHILLGKFGVVMLTGLMSAVVSMFGLYVGLRQSKELPPEMFDMIVKILGADTVLTIFSLLVPLTVFFAGILLSISLSARSFKEAQSLNVSLATKEIIAGTMTTANLIVVYLSLTFFAVLSLWGSVLWFKRESTIFRS
jgi:sodium transport system permease protein